jgi:hypothetical protein
LLKFEMKTRYFAVVISTFPKRPNRPQIADLNALTGGAHLLITSKKENGNKLNHLPAISASNASSSATHKYMSVAGGGAHVRAEQV